MRMVIELRLGSQVRFGSTGEKKDIKEGTYLVIKPGEKVFISSFEEIDFSKQSVEKIFGEKSALIGFINPTTTMMREGISQAATKIDSGFQGNLSWSIRNGSAKEKVIRHGESIFKLTIFLLDNEDELPNTFYGDDVSDTYQHSTGLEESSRLVPSDIGKERRIESTYAEKFSLETLKEMGGAYSHMAKELERIEGHIDGKFNILSQEIDRVDKDIKQIKLDIQDHIKHTEMSIIDSIKSYIHNSIQGNNLKQIISIAGLISFIIGIYSIAQDSNYTNTEIGIASLVIFAIIVVFGLFIYSKK